MIDFTVAPAARARSPRMPSLLLAVTAALATPAAWSGCAVSAQGVDFGTYNPLGRQDHDSAGNISVNCDAGIAYSIALSPGAGVGGARAMRSGANVLNYNLFTDPTHLSMWGDGSGGKAIVAGSGTGSVTNVPVYGRVPGSQSVPSGSYADDIVITVNF